MHKLEYEQFENKVGKKRKQNKAIWEIKNKTTTRTRTPPSKWKKEMRTAKKYGRLLKLAKT